MSLARRSVLLLLWITGFVGASAQDTVPAPAQDLRVVGVTLSGNKVTRDRIILRELLVQEGDSLGTAAFYERLERSRQNLMNTGLFNTVDLLPLFLDMRTVIVEVVVNERWYLWPAIVFDLADPNFNTWWLTTLFLYKIS